MKYGHLGNSYVLPLYHCLYHDRSHCPNDHITVKGAGNINVTSLLVHFDTLEKRCSISQHGH